jgi:hypothetical protein
MQNLWRTGLLALLSLTSAACQEVLTGEPVFNPQNVLPAAKMDAISATVSIPDKCQTEMAWEDAHQAMPSSDLYPCIYTLMGQIDLAYYNFRNDILRAINSGNLAFDALTVGLGTAGTLVPGATTKSILSGIITAANGTRAAINSDLFYNTSALILVAQMDLDRANEQDTILKQLGVSTLTQVNVPPSVSTDVTKRVVTPTGTMTTDTRTTVKVTANPALPVPPAAAPAPTGTPASVAAITTPAPPHPYTLYAASLDLMQYYEAGTWNHALVALQNRTGQQLTNCRAQVKALKTGTATPGTDLTIPQAIGSPNGGC